MAQRIQLSVKHRHHGRRRSFYFRKVGTNERAVSETQKKKSEGGLGLLGRTIDSNNLNEIHDVSHLGRTQSNVNVLNMVFENCCVVYYSYNIIIITKYIIMIMSMCKKHLHVVTGRQ